MNNKILIVEDELVVAYDLQLILEKAGYAVCGLAADFDEAKSIVLAEAPDLVLIDIHLKGQLTGIHLARELKGMNIPFVYLSANTNQKVIDAAIATQPYGFLVKPFREKDLLIALDVARSRHLDNLELGSPVNDDALFSEPAADPFINADGDAGAGPGFGFGPGQIPVSLPGFEGIIGECAKITSVFDQIKKVAAFDTSVLITGETGTGKERVAQVIHKLSKRGSRPIIVIDCTALADPLAEIELFGYEKESADGSFEFKVGKFEGADGGTVFLDEIAEMPLPMQAKLLHIIQTRQLQRTGSKEIKSVDLRFIASTNRQLEKEIGKGRFRLDLYFRLNSFPIHLPKLHERNQDVLLLAQHFAQLISSTMQKPFTGISQSMKKELMSYHWPGNIRELKNIIEHAIISGDGQGMLEMTRKPGS